MAIPEKVEAKSANSDKPIWNSLELTKIIVGALTPLLILVLGFMVNRSVSSRDEAARAAEQLRVRSEQRQATAEDLSRRQQAAAEDLSRRQQATAQDLSRQRQAAVQDLSRFIYERRVRSEMLASAIRRNTDRDEIVERKKLYDEAYVRWNTNHQANLLQIREVLGDRQYSEFDALLESQLVENIFKPLDRCLTEAYDKSIRGSPGIAVLDDCAEAQLLQAALDCGYVLTDELFMLSAQDSASDRSVAVHEIESRCSLPKP